MPNIKSAKKRVKVNETKAAINTMAKSALKTAIKKANVAITASEENATQSVNNAIKMIDKATSKGILQKNTAARKKSSLQTKLNAISAE